MKKVTKDTVCSLCGVKHGEMVDIFEDKDIILCVDCITVADRTLIYGNESESFYGKKGINSFFVNNSNVISVFDNVIRGNFNHVSIPNNSPDA